MSTKFKLEKLLSLKEREKNDVLNEYNVSIARFEKTATKLYELLKQKEDLEEQQNKRMLKGQSILQVQHFKQYVLNLEREILQYQQLVARARSQMEIKKEKVIYSNMEVKKFEKMKERSLDELKALLSIEEKKQMDEISIQQFVNRGN